MDTPTTVAIISLAFPIFILLVMFIFGLYTQRNIGWVGLSFVFGAAWYGVDYLLRPKLGDLITTDHVYIDIIIAPLVRQILVALGVLFVITREKFDNLIDGAAYGFATGLGFATCATAEFFFNSPNVELQLALTRPFATILVLGTASAITGLIMTQFYFRHRANRVVILLSGLGAAIGYEALFNFLVNNSTVNSNNAAATLLPTAFAIGGVTLMSLYITGQLRKILIQVGIEKRRADGLLEIVIPIGVALSTEKNFQKLLERMLVEAKNFCRADAGTLYLKKDKTLEFAVVRNDSLKIAMGGESGEEIKNLPPLQLYDEAGLPNHKNIATHAALTGETVNIEDAYENKEFDFSGAKEFDERTGYISISFLTIPLRDSAGEVQGVLQLLNALDSRKKQIITFDKNLQQLMESFSSLASAALEGYIQEQKLRNEIQQLRIEIDHAKRDMQVAEITDSTYFRKLKEKAKEFKEKDTKKRDEEENPV